MSTPSLSYIESHSFFQVELLSLLVSLILSLLFHTSFPYFVVSAACLFSTAGCLIFELFQHISVGPYAYLEATTTLTFAVILCGTFVYALAKRLSNVEIRWHVITTLGFWSYLALRAVWILEDTARPIYLDIDQQSLEAAGFAALHLMATILMLNDRSVAPPTTSTFGNDEKIADIV